MKASPAKATKIVELAHLYEQQQRIYDEHDRLSVGSNAAMWRAVMSLCGSILATEPCSDLDKAIQIGLAASWINVFVSDLASNDPMLPIANGIEKVLERHSVPQLSAAIFNGSADAVGLEPFLIECRRQIEPAPDVEERAAA